MTETAHDIVAAALAAVIPDIGQISHVDKLALGRAVRAGTLAKWRGYWFPHAGAPVGLGPLKTCYGSPEAAAYFADFKTSFPRR